MMLCSRCSAPITPVVAVDIDGTIGDYYTHFLKFAEAYLARPLPADYAGGEFNDYLKIEKRTYRDIKLAYRQGAQKRSMPAYEGASQFMRQLKDRGIEVWIATTRPYMRLDNIDPDTRFWLERNSIHYDAMIYGEDKYQQLTACVEKRRIIGVIEDLKDQCWRAYTEGLTAWQPERPHNRDDRFPVSFSSFDEAIKIIDRRLEGWWQRWR